MEPKYSILLCNQNIADYENKIEHWLKDGIKVIWFGTEQDVTMLKKKFHDFSKAFLLQAYILDHDRAGIVIDGDDSERLIDTLEDLCPVFNAAQYRVEIASRRSISSCRHPRGRGRPRSWWTVSCS